MTVTVFLQNCSCIAPFFGDFPFVWQCYMWPSCALGKCSVSINWSEIRCICPRYPKGADNMMVRVSVMLISTGIFSHNKFHYDKNYRQCERHEEKNRDVTTTVCKYSFHSKRLLTEEKASLERQTTNMICQIILWHD